LGFAVETTKTGISLKPMRTLRKTATNLVCGVNPNTNFDMI